MCIFSNCCSKSSRLLSSTNIWFVFLHSCRLNRFSQLRCTIHRWLIIKATISSSHHHTILRANIINNLLVITNLSYITSLWRLIIKPLIFCTPFHHITSHWTYIVELLSMSSNFSHKATLWTLIIKLISLTLSNFDHEATLGALIINLSSFIILHVCSLRANIINELFISSSYHEASFRCQIIFILESHHCFLTLNFIICLVLKLMKLLYGVIQILIFRNLDIVFIHLIFLILIFNFVVNHFFDIFFIFFIIFDWYLDWIFIR